MYLDAESDETQTQLSEDKIPSQGQTGKDGNDLDKIQTQGIEKHLKNASQLSQNGGSDSLLVVCCEDVLLLLSLASLIQVCTWPFFLGYIGDLHVIALRRNTEIQLTQNTHIKYMNCFMELPNFHILPVMFLSPLGKQQASTEDETCKTLLLVSSFQKHG